MDSNKHYCRGIDSIPQTMLLTLFARAKHSMGKNPAFKDEKSIEILKGLDYDFALADKDVAMSSGTVARTIVLDKLLKERIEACPDCTIVNLGCGLDTKFHRLDNGRIRWFDVDLPEVIEIRRRFFSDTDRVTMIVGSAMEDGWAEKVGNNPGKTFIVIEGLSMYLEDSDIRQIFNVIGKHFTDVEVIMEIMPRLWLRHGHKVEKSVAATKAAFRWAADSGREVMPLADGFEWKGDRDIMEGMCRLYPVMRILYLLPHLRRIYTEKFTFFQLKK